MTLRRRLPLNGLLFVVLMAVVLGFAGSAPGADDSSAKISAFYHAHHVQQSLLCFVLVVGAMVLVVFAATVDRALTSGRPAESALGRVVFLAGTTIGAGSSRSLPQHSSAFWQLGSGSQR